MRLAHRERRVLPPGCRIRRLAHRKVVDDLPRLHHRIEEQRNRARRRRSLDSALLDELAHDADIRRLANLHAASRRKLPHERVGVDVRRPHAHQHLPAHVRDRLRAEPTETGFDTAPTHRAHPVARAHCVDRGAAMAIAVHAHNMQAGAVRELGIGAHDLVPRGIDLIERDRRHECRVVDEDPRRPPEPDHPRGRRVRRHSGGRPGGCGTADSSACM